MMADVNIAEWLKQYGQDATIGYEAKSDGYQITASNYRASPARIRIYKFALQSSAEQFCDLLRQRYQPRPPRTVKGKQPGY